MQKNAMPVPILENEPTDAIKRGRSVRRLLRSKKESERVRLEEARLQKRGAETDEIFRRRQIPTAGPLVAVVDGGRNHELPLRIALIKLGAIRIDEAFPIGTR